MRSLDPPLVLVADDLDDAREMYAELLAFAGYRVARANSGEQAIERALDLRPSLILMDLGLPGLDGWEATRRLKADPRTAHIPVVALSGHALDEHRRIARDAGCAGFLSKPCLPDELLRTVRSLVST